MNNFIKYSLILLLLCSCKNQRTIDESFKPKVDNPEYNIGEGPLILIDEAHNNYHTKDGLYSPLARLLTADGYQVNSLKQLTKESLSNARILIISNAMPKNYRINTSAFTEDEVVLIRDWVKNGGSLLFIADHMPCPEAATNLASAFGFNFINCFAMDTLKNDFDFFNIKDSTLVKCSITKGRNSNETIDSVVTFTGQAFEIPDQAIPILKFHPNYLMVIPDRPWHFDHNTKYIPITNQVQGAILKYDKGRIAVFGEASMFTAQIENNMAIGFGYPKAKQNAQFTLNIIHWLDNKIE
jgi:hypothetical protein